MASTGETLFRLGYEISPIILVGGIVQQYINEPYLPITVLTEILDVSGFISGEFFAHYKPLANSTLIDFDVAEYPFANLTMAANAVVLKPLSISLLMTCPAQNPGGYILKLAIMTLLQQVITNHVLQGGHFIVLTPAQIYNNCLLTTVRDVSSPSDKQVQLQYQWDFVQPLLTESAGTAILNSHYTFWNNGLPI